LRDVVQNLAKQVGFNFILDPRLDNRAAWPEGKSHWQTLVTKRWENQSAKYALDALLKEHGLMLAEIPSTTVTRITFANPKGTFTPASFAGTNANTVLPVVRMEEVPFDAAINNLARVAGLDVELDPKLSDHLSRLSGARFPSAMVSFSWQNLTAGQALSALLENYDLVAVKKATRDEVEDKKS